MEIDLGTFLVTVYCVVDDLYRSEFAPLKPARPGKKPELSDSEVLTLMVLAQWFARRSESGFVRYARKHWPGYFPRMLSQSAFNRRGRDLGGVLCAMAPALAEGVAGAFGLAPAYEVMDAVPVPLMRRCRGDRHRLFAAEAAVGRGGSDKDWFYGVKLFLVVDAAGLVTGFVVGPADTEERWLAEALFRWRRDPAAPEPRAAELAPALGPSHRKGGGRVGPTGPIRPRQAAGKATDLPGLGDLGYRGAAWAAHRGRDYGARVLTKAGYPAPEGADPRAWFNGLRQKVETSFSALTDYLGLCFPRARTHWGLLTRIGAKAAAFNLMLHLNLLLQRPTYAFLNPFEL
jgi:DDE family transposase